MLRKNNRLLPLLFIVTLSLLLTEKAGRGTITSITLTPANPTTLSNTLGYYLAGKAYTFTINVIDPDATGWADITDVSLTIANPALALTGAPPYIPNATQMRVFFAPAAGPGAYIPTVAPLGTVNAAAMVAGTFNNFTATFTITFRWDSAQCPWGALRNITGYARTSVPADNFLSDLRPVSYGIRSTITIVGFTQDGDAADGMVNPWHTSFNVTGTIAYNIPGAAAADAVHLIADAGIGEYAAPGAILYRTGNLTPHVDATPAALSIPVSPEWFNSLGWATARGNHTWTVVVAMATPGGPETSVNTLAINCDRIQVTNIQFLGGGGVNPPPRYYRSVNLPGTQVRITAQLENAGTPMVGNTTIRVGEFDGTDNPTGATTDVVIANGLTIGLGNLTYPPGAATPAGDTTPLRYGAIRVHGGAYDGAPAGAVGQYIDDFVPPTPNPLRITQAVYPAYIIYWDNNDPPGANAGGFTTWVNQQPTATSLELTWGPIDPLVNDDHDFYSYRIYYREHTTIPWIMIDRNTANYGPPAGTFRLDLIATGTAAIQGLVPLTTYDYFVSAVDVFGNEIYTLFPGSVIHGPPGPAWGEIQTQPLTILAEVTDGITAYQDNSFTLNPLASARPLRDTAIRVKLNIAGIANTLPETVNLIVAEDPGVADLIFGGTVNPAAMPWYRINCSKSGPNTWTGYIPDTNPLIAIGTDVRFVIEMINGASTTYADHNSELEVPAGIPPVTPNDYEWNFSVITPTAFQPWPTRILNNVITDKDPVAYPAYYLSEDAYVTIKAFDIKGRPVATLLDNAFRKGGQNIKEGGWRGDNKANRKLGVGLYYIQIEAKSVSSGKVILNSFQKVVMAR